MQRRPPISTLFPYTTLFRSALDPIERGNEMHLRRARIGEAHLDAAGDQRAHQALRAIHHPAVRDIRSVQHGFSNFTSPLLKSGMPDFSLFDWPESETSDFGSGRGRRAKRVG